MIAAVLGGAKGGIDELVALSTRKPVAVLFAVNDAAAEYPGHVDYFVTLHPAKLDMWLERRHTLKLSPPSAVVAHIKEPGVTETAEYRWPEWPATVRSGSSGLYAARLAMEKTTLPVVLCGVPMDTGRTHYAESTFDKDCDEFRPAWKASLHRLKGRVTSMSGWTAELLGRPF